MLQLFRLYYKWRNGSVESFSGIFDVKVWKLPLLIWSITKMFGQMLQKQISWKYLLCYVMVGLYIHTQQDTTFNVSFWHQKLANQNI